MPEWNEAQQEVLDSIKDHQNILVSAAAGSGKTAVLVERIIRTVLEGKADIDEILVVTFTRAAASQMKAKIIAALEKAVSEKADSNLTKQLMLAESADIMTIDSFCHKIVKENFQVAGVDPAFDIYDKEEIVLLTEDVLDEVMDAHYRDDEVFRDLSRFLMKKNLNDDELRGYILNISRIADSFADPSRWLDEAGNEYDALRESGTTKWIEEYKKYIKTLTQGYYEYSRKLADKMLEELGQVDTETAQKLYDMYISDAMIMRTISEQDSLLKMSDASKTKWKNFPRKQAVEALDEERVKRLTNERDTLKQSVKTIYSEEELQKEIETSAKYIKCLVTVVSEFREALLKEKEKCGKYEFSDISHAAYRVLYDTEKNCPSETGRRMADIYKYIYIDEYQDSNDLQENVINAVARRDADGYINNVFMVGDIKQSIYRFRLARPDLFAEKADNYVNGEGGRLISLNMNYRSRKEVLDATNFVFREIMNRQFGGIDYDENAELHTPDIASYQTNYPEAGPSDNISGIPELILINKTREEGEGETELSSEEQEATVIGRRILELVNGDEEKGIKPLMVKNENYRSDRPVSVHNPLYRPLRYSDIVILQRKVSGTTAMLKIYEQMGIPVTLEDSSGYFDAMEVVTMLSVLRVIDNIQQDIPLASVLLSGIGGFSDEELAMVVSLSEEKYISLADKLAAFEEGYFGSNSDMGRVAEKIKNILGKIADWSRLKPYISIAQLLDRIIGDTRYDEYIAAMPDGKKRVANLKMLRVRANHFESVRNNGLLDFLNYIKKCQIHDIDFGEASVSERVDDSVTVMSIHKSKGLEFPVVFVARLGQQFRLREMSDNVAADSDYYIAMNNFYYVDDIMVKRSSLKKEVIKLLSEKEIKTEESRLLYVAMTRAKEKLIMIGSYAKDAPAMPLTSGSMLDYIRYAMTKNNPLGIFDIKEISMYEAEDNFKKLYIKKSIEYKDDMDKLLTILKEKSDKVDSENPYSYVYPFEEMTRLGAKMSVSEIKHIEMEKNLTLLDNSKNEIENEAANKTENEMDSISDEERELLREKAATRGTIIHSLFEKIDYRNISSRDDLMTEYNRVLSGKEYSDSDRELVNVKVLSDFYSKDEESVFARMKKAALAGKLMREQQFIVGLSNSEIPGRKGKDSDEDFTVVQGIIDAYFMEINEAGNEDIVLVDYKTDNVKDGRELLDRYASQMYLYSLTLEKLTGMKVKDVILYSTKFGEVHYKEWRDYNSPANRMTAKERIINE